jgi:hypothetical protein
LGVAVTEPDGRARAPFFFHRSSKAVESPLPLGSSPMDSQLVQLCDHCSLSTRSKYRVHLLDASATTTATRHNRGGMRQRKMPHGEQRESGFRGATGRLRRGTLLAHGLGCLTSPRNCVGGFDFLPDNSVALACGLQIEALGCAAIGCHAPSPFQSGRRQAPRRSTSGLRSKAYNGGGLCSGHCTVLPVVFQVKGPTPSLFCPSAQMSHEVNGFMPCLREQQFVVSLGLYLLVRR